MKTALELLGDGCGRGADCPESQIAGCTECYELVAKRAREEMREACAAAVDAIPCAMGGDIDITETVALIRALPVESKP